VNPISDPDPGKVSQKVSAVVTASAGQKLLLRLSNLSVTSFFTITALGLPMKVVGSGAHILRGPGGTSLYYDTGSVTLGGGEAADVIVDTTGIAPGTYVLYTTNLNYLSNNTEDYGGMMTEIVIN
jgi:FtsP/CotA-like multicopper oxidase with cupredoxin domain